MKRFFIAFCIFCIFICSCRENYITPDPVIVEVMPSTHENVGDTLKAVRVSVSYLGDPYMDEMVDSWVINLYSNEDIAYEKSTGQYEGEGRVISLLAYTILKETPSPELNALSGNYFAQKSTDDFTSGSYEWGMTMTMDNPYLGRLEYPTGSFFSEQKGGERHVDYLRDGSFSFIVEDDGSVSINGVLVGTDFKKRCFTYEGRVDMLPYQAAGSPDFNMTEGFRINKNNMPEFSLRDKGDSYWLSDKSYREYVLLFSGSGVSHASSSPYGEGPLFRLNMFVDYDADNRVPEGEYSFFARAPHEGIYRDDIIPFHLVPGYSGKFSDPQGCWFMTFDGYHWTGEYALIDSGYLRVSYSESDPSTPSFEGEFYNSKHPEVKITINW